MVLASLSLQRLRLDGRVQVKSKHVCEKASNSSGKQESQKPQFPEVSAGFQAGPGIKAALSPCNAHQSTVKSRQCPLYHNKASSQAETGVADLSHCSICSWFTKPACCNSRRPLESTMKLGMPRTLKRAAS